MLARPSSLRLAAPLIFAVLLSSVACSGDPDAGAEDHHEDEESVGSVSSSLAANATVAQAVTSECATVAVKGLSVQLVEEVQCLRPNTFMKIDNTPGLALGVSVFPYMQTSAAKALVAAQKARGVTMSINSAVRTLAQQYLLYRWYQTGRCNIGLAASPGTSNHEGAIAIDINDNAGWRTSLQGKGFRWLGANDPVHYDFIGGGTVNLKGLSVQAFQRLWNRNNPNDKIAEDGDYGAATAARIAQSPANGFAKGADCNKPAPAPAPAPAPDGGTGLTVPGNDPLSNTPSNVPIIPDANEGGESDPAAASADAPPANGPLTRPVAEATGCSLGSLGRAHAPDGSAGSTGRLGLGIAAALVLASRRRRRARAHA